MDQGCARPVSRIRFRMVLFFQQSDLLPDRSYNSSRIRDLHLVFKNPGTGKQYHLRFLVLSGFPLGGFDLKHDRIEDREMGPEYRRLWDLDSWNDCDSARGRDSDEVRLRNAFQCESTRSHQQSRYMDFLVVHLLCVCRL